MNNFGNCTPWHGRCPPESMKPDYPNHFSMDLNSNDNVELEPENIPLFSECYENRGTSQICMPNYQQARSGTDIYWPFQDTGYSSPSVPSNESPQYNAPANYHSALQTTYGYSEIVAQAVEQEVSSNVQQENPSTPLDEQRPITVLENMVINPPEVAILQENTSFQTNDECYNIFHPDINVPGPIQIQVLHEAQSAPIAAAVSPESNLPAHRGTFRCTYCSKFFEKKFGLKQHINWVHINKPSNKCVRCGKNFATVQKLNNHIEQHEMKDKAHKCPDCPKQYCHKTDLKRHSMSHSSRPFVCHIQGCTKAFVRKDHLVMHQQSRIHRKKLRGKR